MYLSEYNADSNIKVSDDALLERIQVIDPSFSLSNAIHNYNRQKEDEDDPMYPLFSFLCKSKWLSISDMYEEILSIYDKSVDYDELSEFMFRVYPEVSIKLMKREVKGNDIVLEGIDANSLYRLFVTYKNTYDPFTYKFNTDNWISHSRMEATREDTGYASRMVVIDPIYSSDEIPIDSSFSLRDQLRLVIEKANRDKDIEAKIESMKSSPAYDIFIQMKDKAYTMYMMDDHIDMHIRTNIPLVFPKEIRARRTTGVSYTEYTLSGDLSIMSDVALLYVLHDNCNYNFDEDSILII